MFARWTARLRKLRCCLSRREWIIRLPLINTHLGLNAAERIRQVDCLLGTSWLENARCTAPTVSCGDLNASPFSAAYRRVS